MTSTFVQANPYPWPYDGNLAPGTTALLIIEDRKSTRLNSSHSQISYAVFCLKKKECECLSARLSEAGQERQGKRPPPDQRFKVAVGFAQSGRAEHTARPLRRIADLGASHTHG